ncbi:MAG: UDP-N-acetylenolpyruvoylglucosamine reductase [Ignavibacteria bacterium CG_4_9_14_0_2_um_filter_37_13]|nr:MAG: UDP-N-acetylenolpyruvoylglucosamine reductase [Ignavibacteria bacterium CG_4_9_14_0_2_um_filter_37_13]
MNFQENYNLQKKNTFGLRLFAKYFCEVFSITELKKVLEQFKGEKILLLGSGSNILFTKNFDGLVLQFNQKGIYKIEEDRDSVLLEVFAGELWDDFVSYCVGNNFYGVENLSLIPGTVGAAPIQNIGAYGQEVKDTFFALNGIYLTDSSEKTFIKHDCNFGYRTTIFKNELKNKFIITSVLFRLQKNFELNTHYGSIEQELKSIGKKNPTLADIRNIVIKIRNDKLPDPKVLGNSGSFFKNPEIEKNHYAKLKAGFPSLKGFPTSEDTIKIPAGWLIEQCGWKGKRTGNVGVHEHQALVLVNYGKADGNEVLQLSQKIKEDVYQKFEIQLEEEVNIV